jgi:hypothetical protein
MLKLASEGLLEYGMIWSCDFGTKPSIFENAWLRQPIEHPVLQILNTYLNILITSKFYILARYPQNLWSTFYERSCVDDVGSES